MPECECGCDVSIVCVWQLHDHDSQHAYADDLSVWISDDQSCAIDQRDCFCDEWNDDVWWRIHESEWEHCGAEQRRGIPRFGVAERVSVCEWEWSGDIPEVCVGFMHDLDSVGEQPDDLSDGDAELRASAEHRRNVPSFVEQLRDDVSFGFHECEWEQCES